MMAMNLGVTLLARLPSLLACVAGVIVGVVLVTRRRDTAAWLALVGFGLLLAMDVGSWLTNLLPAWVGVHSGAAGVASIAGLVGVLGIVVHIGSAAGILCLAAALWVGLGNSNRQGPSS